VDAQAAAEAGMSLLAAACTGTAFVHNVGYLSGGRTGSLEMLLLCDELAGAIRAFSAGIPVSEDTLALETIRRAAPDRSFLTDEHTVANVRCAMWQPRLLQRGTLEAWEAAGGKTCTLRLRERLRELLDGGSG
jgi:trimethylamine--corrinoid protein Co-methyltransferase